MPPKWLLFCVQLPATPSGPRVMLWRRMRAAGSASLNNGIWILPISDKSVSFVQEMQSFVEHQGGSSLVFEASAFTPPTEDKIIERFRHDRQQEYYEIKEQCSDFLAEIDKETRSQNFSFAEYEENEQDLEKLEIWLEKVKQRDFLGGDQADTTAALLESCRQALQGFASAVFDSEGSDQPRMLAADS